MKSNVVMLTFAFLLILIPHSTSTEAQTVPQTETMPCLLVPFGEIEGETMACGRIQVPLDRDDPDGGVTDIAYAILYSTGDNPSPDPILFISGGPGQSILRPLEFAQMWNSVARLRANHHIIFYDQRGVGLSQPQFACLPSFFDAQAETSSQQQCVDALRDMGIDPAYYSTVANADDTLDLMRALDYDGYHLFGTSYGTRIAMMLIDRYPDEPLIRTFIFDSVYPLPEDRFFVFTNRKTEVFEGLIDLCIQDTACNEAYPDLRVRYDVAHARIIFGEFDGLAVEDIFFPFYSTRPEYIPYQPRLIVELSYGVRETLDLLQSNSFILPDAEQLYSFLATLFDGDTCITLTAVDQEIASQATRLVAGNSDDLVAFVDLFCDGPARTELREQAADFNQFHILQVAIRVLERYTNTLEPQIEPINQWMNVMINCTESYPFLSPEARPEYTELCEGPLLGSDPLEQPTDPTVWDVPTLMLHGELDSTTPVHWAEMTSEFLPQSHLIIFPGSIHSIFSIRNECATDIILDFLTEPTTAPDSSCTEQFVVEFVMPDDPLPGE